MPLSRASSIAQSEREALFHTMMTPKGSRPTSPVFPGAASSRRTDWALRGAEAVLAVAGLALLLLSAAMFWPVDENYEWKRDGCHVKILELSSGMNTTLAVSAPSLCKSVLFCPACSHHLHSHCADLLSAV